MKILNLLLILLICASLGYAEVPVPDDLNLNFRYDEEEAELVIEVQEVHFNQKAFREAASPYGLPEAYLHVLGRAGYITYETIGEARLPVREVD